MMEVALQGALLEQDYVTQRVVGRAVSESALERLAVAVAGCTDVGVAMCGWRRGLCAALGVGCRLRSVGTFEAVRGEHAARAAVEVPAA